MMNTSEMWLLDCLQGFTLIWLGDIVFDLMWPSFKLNLKNIKTNRMSKIHDEYFKNVTSGVLTRFSFGLAWWPSFWPKVTQFRTDLKTINTNILSKIHDDYIKNVPLEC